MPERPRILYVLESMIGFRIREQELSIPIQERVVQLVRVERRMEHLRDESEALNRRRKYLLAFVLVTGAGGAGGLVIGLWGLLQNYLTNFQSAISIWGSIGVFLVDYSITIFTLRLQVAIHEHASEIARLSVTFDEGMEILSRQVLQEPPATRLPLD